RVDAQGDLEVLRAPLGELDDLAEFVDFRAQRLAAVLDRTIRAAPARDGGEPAPAGHGRPVVQDDRLPRRAPGEAVGGDGTAGRADVLADGEVEVVPREAGPGVARGLPDLREAGIDVDEGLPAETARQRLGGEVAADVDQEDGLPGQVE